jgi:hypothetical protein
MENVIVQQLLQICFCLLILSLWAGCDADSLETPEKSSHRIDGKVYVSSSKDKDWVSGTRVLVDGGKFRGFLR